MKIRLLLADDHQLMREGLRAIIEGRQGFQVVGEAANGRHLETQVRDCGAHVVIMDVAMPDLNGFEATRKILNLHPHVKIVALSAHIDKEYIREMLCAGASAYVLKEQASEELIRAIREVMDGKKYLSPDVAGSVVDEYVELSGERADHPAFILLTDREREVLQQLAEGSTTKEMADCLHVSVKTIETHRRNIMEKLDLHSVAGLTKYAIREGMTSMDF